MSTESADAERKAFVAPTKGKAGVYIYRDSLFGYLVRKGIYIDDMLIGRTAVQTYFYREVAPGSHVIATDAEFGTNEVRFFASAGQNYYFRQYLKIGTFVASSDIRRVDARVGQRDLQNCRLAE